MSLLPRIHAFEWEDQRWFPSFLRDCMTDFLEFIARIAKMYRPLPDRIGSALADKENKSILDLASGGGGPWHQITPSLIELHPDVKIILSDFYPNLKAFRKLKERFPNNIEFIEQPVDATNVEVHPQLLRTQFLSLHHFRRAQCIQIFSNAIDDGAPILIVEGQQRNIPSLIGMLLSPINVLLMTPFIRPFRWDRLLFTYIIPILPLLVMWDGIISVFRTYTESELMKMAAETDRSNQFKWTFEKMPKSPVTLFMGTPLKDA